MNNEQTKVTNNKTSNPCDDMEKDKRTPLLDKTTDSKDKSNTSSFISKNSKKLKFKEQYLEVIHVESYKEFNVDVVNEKRDVSCLRCKKCILF
jgi:hypothetical protein